MDIIDIDYADPTSPCRDSTFIQDTVDHCGQCSVKG